MNITLEEIAKLAEVSRGTVDRVMHKRGRVSKKTEEKILKIIAKTKYEPNSLGRAFALSQKNITIGVIFSFKEKEFQEQVMKGISDGVDFAAQYGLKVLVDPLPYYSPKICVDAIKQMKENGVQGLAIKGLPDLSVVKILRTLKKDNIRIVVFNSAMSERIEDSFVGQNNLDAGKCVAHLIKEICHLPGSILMIGDEAAQTDTRERLDSFRKELKSSTHHLTCSEDFYCSGSSAASYMITSEFIQEHPNLRGIFVSGPGVSGACKAVKDFHLVDKVKIVGFDMIGQNVKYLKQGVAQFLIDQDPYNQGYLPIRLLVDNLFNGTVIKQRYYDTGTKIKCRYNLL